MPLPRLRSGAVSSSSCPWCARSGGRAPYFQPQAGGHAVRLQMGCVYHQLIGVAALIRHFEKHPGKDTLLAPPLPSVVVG